MIITSRTQDRVAQAVVQVQLPHSVRGASEVERGMQFYQLSGRFGGSPAGSIFA